ncbi:MAG: 4-hydroxyphenylpyruvate dioxygenase [Nocardiopsaceae bacterium]|nr:4-hydroxyphenylpyruvate dioxygenase [Nocardiopsaceae bacterium]
MSEREGSLVAAQDVEYVELYTNDEQSTLQYFVSSLGFTHVAESAGDGSHSSLVRQGTMQLVITAGRGTEAFLEAHGDGIADIAFGCDDAAETYRQAVSAGASVVSSKPDRLAVSGFGDTCHTLVTRSANAGPPADRAWQPIAGAPTPTGHIRLLDHIAVCVESGSLADCTRFYADAFGLGKYSSEYIEVGDQAMDSIVVRSPSDGITFTILEQDLTKKSGQVEAFLSRNGGAGVQHLAFLVDDIISAVRVFRGRGIEFLDTPDAYYDMLAERLPGLERQIADLRATDVLADRDEWGYLLQLFTRSPYKRNTMFCELVQRRGARGFGSANINALYQAVERDELADG